MTLRLRVIVRTGACWTSFTTRFSNCNLEGYLAVAIRGPRP
jgi:hypothetical protein